MQFCLASITRAYASPWVERMLVSWITANTRSITWASRSFEPTVNWSWRTNSYRAGILVTGGGEQKFPLARGLTPSWASPTTSNMPSTSAASPTSRGPTLLRTGSRASWKSRNGCKRRTLLNSSVWTSPRRCSASSKKWRTSSKPKQHSHAVGDEIDRQDSPEHQGTGATRRQAIDTGKVGESDKQACCQNKSASSSWKRTLLRWTWTKKTCVR